MEVESALVGIHNRIVSEHNVSARSVHAVVQANAIYGDVHINEPKLAVPQQLPHGVGDLVGRAADLEMLDRASHSASRVVVISGTAGVGKTALCLHWARSVAARFPGGQLYVDLRGFDPSHPPLSTEEVVRGFLDGFGIPPERIRSGVDAHVNLYRSMTADRRMLVVLDNARDAEQVRPLLPGGSKCVVVVTSRTEMTGLLVREGARRIGLDLLDEADARRLVASRVDGVSADSDAVGVLVARCAGLPLALAIVAGRAVQRRSFSLSVLADELCSATQRLDALDTGDPYTTARSVFSWSYEALPLAAQRLFRLLGSTIGSDVALPAAASLVGLSCARTRVVLSDLVRANLVDEHVPGRFRLHDLLREYAAELLAEEPAEQRVAATTRMIDSYLHTAVAADAVLNPHRLRIEVPPPQPDVVVVDVSDYQKALDWCVAEHRLAVSAVELAVRVGLDRHAWQLAWALVTYLRRSSHHLDRQTTQRLALAAARRLGDPYGEAKICRVLGKSLVRQGREVEAEDFLERAVALFHELGEQAEEADALLGLVTQSWRQDRLGEADADARRALMLAEAAGSTNLRAIALIAIGRCALALGNPRETVGCCTAALVLYRAVDNDEGRAYALRVLGSAYHDLGQWDAAVVAYEESLGLDVALRDDYFAALVLDQIGLAHQAAGRMAKATLAWRRSVELLECLGNTEVDGVRARLNAVT